jgi:hypothetical protein
VSASRNLNRDLLQAELDRLRNDPNDPYQRFSPESHAQLGRAAKVLAKLGIEMGRPKVG